MKHPEITWNIRPDLTPRSYPPANPVLPKPEKALTFKAKEIVGCSASTLLVFEVLCWNPEAVFYRKGHKGKLQSIKAIPGRSLRAFSFASLRLTTIL